MTDEDLPDENVLDLVMPFVVVASAGGPYDDDAFVAGCEFADLYRDLQTVRGLRHLQLVQARFEKYVPPEIVPQLDLAAMDCGFKLTATPWGEPPDGWVHAVFEYGLQDSDDTDGT